MKKVVCVLGSPRTSGNSESIARKFCDITESLGAETEVFNLNNLTYKGCQACMACKSGHEECVVTDGLTNVLKAIREADILLMASPIYFGQISGQVKCLIDRMYSFLKPTYMVNNDRSRLDVGKKAILIATQGNPSPDKFDAFATYTEFFGPEWFGFEVHVIRGLGLIQKTDAAEQDDLLKRVEETAQYVLVDTAPKGCG